MPTDRNHNRVRSRWGMCLNDQCERSKNHDCIEVVGRKDFVCPDCGKPLKECPPPKEKTPWGKYAAVAAAVLVLGGGGYFGYTQLAAGSDEEAEAKTDTTVVQSTPSESVDQEPVNEDPGTDSTEVKGKGDEAAKNPLKEKEGIADGLPQAGGKAEPKTQPKNPNPVKVDPPSGSQRNPSHGTVRVSYGSYTGDLRNGQPHGYGTVRFTKTYRINSECVAHAGDSYEGEFRDGRIAGGQGYWKHDGDMTRVMP